MPSWIDCATLPERFRRDLQGEVDSRGHAAAGDDIAVDHHALGDRRRAERAQHLAAHPVRRGALALKQSRGAEHQRAGAHARDVARAFRLTADEVERLGIVEQRVHASAAGHADEIELRAVRERRGRRDLHAAARRHRLSRFPDEMHFRVGKLDEDLVRAGHVELRDVGEQQKTDVEGHGRARALCRCNRRHYATIRRETNRAWPRRQKSWEKLGPRCARMAHDRSRRFPGIRLSRAPRRFTKRCSRRSAT